MFLKNVPVGVSDDGYLTKDGTKLVVYRTGEVKNGDRDILLHAGSLEAAQDRYYDYIFHMYRTNCADVYSSTSDYIHRVMDGLHEKRISAYHIKAQNPLYVADTWDDDPIGSGGLSILGPSWPHLSQPMKSSFEKAFLGFRNPVYDEHVCGLERKSIKFMRKQIQGNPTYKALFDERIDYITNYRHDDKDAAQNREVVWMYMTQNFHTCCLKHGFDNLVYENTSEGSRGDLSFVTFRPGQLIPTGEFYAFAASIASQAIGHGDCEWQRNAQGRTIGIRWNKDHSPWQRHAPGVPHHPSPISPPPRP
ncbi:MAG: hypothetical protein IPI58_06655 [Alphaproteobacteria bacterium]|nr:MAG: hypothetical protein IPI58_06655 [Alphaproteobacteria bacterium]